MSVAFHPSIRDSPPEPPSAAPAIASNFLYPVT